MRNLKYLLVLLTGLGIITVSDAHINPDTRYSPTSTSNQNNGEINYRESCDNAIAQTDLAVNNVRARLTTGGDIWWDGENARYIVPKVKPGVPEVSSIYAAAVWMGGLDDGGNLKVAAQTYGRANGNFDYWPGPLIPDGVDQGEVEKQTCTNWDRFFKVTAIEIDQHRALFQKAKNTGMPYNESTIPLSVKGWPAKGNPYFADVLGFELPVTSQGLAGFHDYDGDGNYDPTQGDFPIMEIRGCTNIYYADEMIFWIYNDAGGPHSASGSPLKLNMEIQVQAFAFSTNDEFNNMTFQRYKLINRATTSIDSTFFAFWVDPDLGCFTDDFVGCDVERSLAYIYNEDAVDGTVGCDCQNDVNTYCEEVPILGIDYFRGPLNEFGEELGMTSFTYHNSTILSDPPIGTLDPFNEQEYYNYMTGSWRDGSHLQFGGDGYQQGTENVNYAFSDPPDDESGWSMCSGSMLFGDRRTVQSSGPFRLNPGAVNELIIGALWIPDQAYPCPSIRKLQEVDDYAQALFNGCFHPPSGPDAPDVDFIELDQEIIAVLSNSLPSNNTEEQYQGYSPFIPGGVEDSLYRFEGYRIFQLSHSDIDFLDQNVRSNPDKIRIVAEVDIANGIGKIFNWKRLEDQDRPDAAAFFVPELQVDGTDQGIRHSFRITEDQFATDDRRLINHKKYYFVAVAYAFNEYEPFDPMEQIGQKKSYLEGRRNIGPNQDGKPYTVIPRPIVDRKLNAQYGEGAIVTRIDGTGSGPGFIDISNETRKAIEESFNSGIPVHEITYQPGRAPIEVVIYDPLDVKDEVFELTFTDENMDNDQLDQEIYWKLKNLSNPEAPEILSNKTIADLNEQIISEYGFSISIRQVDAAGTNPFISPTNGFIGYEEDYVNENMASAWISGIPDGTQFGLTPVDQTLFDYVQNDEEQEFYNIDPNQVFSKVGSGYFVPYYLCNWTGNEGPFPDILTPAWTRSIGNGNGFVHLQTDLKELNNVDIFFTSDKNLWSRCVIIETANKWITNAGLPVEGGNTVHFDLRKSKIVSKYDNDRDGLPDVDWDNVLDENLDTIYGLGWFPGYAIDVETGQRLNIFFGENSVYDGGLFPEAFLSKPAGRDMMFNPSSQLFLNTGFLAAPYSFNYYAGGQHYVYVTKEPYDGCVAIAKRLKHSNSPATLEKVSAIKKITWAGLIMPVAGQRMLPYQEGLIPEDVVVKLRVNNPYEVKTGTGEFNGYPTYRFKIEAQQADALDTDGVETALDMINVVPNPYFGFSEYETSRFTTTVKITNLPAKCVVLIYTLDGRFVRRFKRDETGAEAKGSAIGQAQILPDIEWDLKNVEGKHIPGGIYLIYINAEGLGERTLKWLGVNRQF